MTKDAGNYGYIFSVMGSVNDKEKLFRLGVNIAKEVIFYFGHGF